MTLELLNKLYSKLKSEPENHRKNKTGCFDFFEERILTQQAFLKYRDISVTAKTMKNYYEKHVEGRKNKSKEPSPELKNCIAEYLGFRNYLHFCNNNSKTSKFTLKYFIFNFKKNIHLTTFVFIILMIFFMSPNDIVTYYQHKEIKGNKQYINTTLALMNINVFKKIETESYSKTRESNKTSF